MRYIGTTPLHRVSEEQTKRFFEETRGHMKKHSKMQAGVAIVGLHIVLTREELFFS